MGTGGSVQPSLFDGLDDAGTGPVVVVGLVAGQKESTEGSDDRSSADSTSVPAVTETRNPTPAGVGGWAAEHPRPTAPVTRLGRRAASGRRVVPSAEEWGRVQAERAPRWTHAQRAHAAGMFGLVLPSNAAEGDGGVDDQQRRSA
ncbi:hypothetical protein KBI5_19780 [Frankia sp. KB5]|nr:hypothetical protein KBI5_19780 [Frankia sp. KB5]